LPQLIGQLPAANIQPISFPVTSSMTTDANFRARRIAADGNILVAENYPSGTDTNKLLVYDLSTGSPVWSQTIALSTNTRDVVVRNGIAYVAGQAVFYAYDLTVNPAVGKSAGTGCTDANSVAVDGSYAYVAAGGNCGDGRVTVFDITDPKTPVAVGS